MSNTGIPQSNTGIPKAAPKSKAPLAIGVTLAAAAGLGYYFFSPSAQARVARAEQTVAAQKHARGDTLGKAQEELGKLGENIDGTLAAGQQKIEAVKEKANVAGSKVLEGVDKVDHKLEKEAEKAKSTLSGWFTGKK
ncbi:hypothetical protein BJ508DRAFT_415944 [Ascobolus immersus RN42]|uniref:Calcofluor white hypersensitive protein n=1 Tax=Ascobolus immersus RN42 TaxID=1160509 RepID=A0A3N4I5U0_ASCIM|nr:hypothetical protein BJ508DRAFT_415944 [Ascobolus immersus RN42]